MHTAAIEVAAGLVFRDGLLLIAQRRPQDHLGGLWEFPGGKRQAGESFEECLRRELLEELGIEVAVGRLLETVVHNYPGRRVHLNFYRCAWRRHEPRALGCQAWAWVDRSQLADYSFPAADARLLELLAAKSDWWARSS
jgi:mutator protein MutT